MIQYACALCQGETILREHLPPELLTAANPGMPTGGHADHEEKGHSDQLSEKDSILAMLDKTDWNKAKAARQLGVSRATLYTKLLKYGIETQSEDD